MVDFIKTQNNFAHGEIDAEFFARDDIAGVAKLVNMDVVSGGGLTRRAGLKKVANLNGLARIIPFSVSENENYIIVIGNRYLDVLSTDGTRVQSLVSPWSTADTDKLQYAQRFGTIIFVHPDYQPRVMSPKNNGGFELNIFGFSSNDDMSVNIPFMQFDDALGITITVTSNAGGNNFATFTTNRNFWKPECVGELLFLMNKQWEITSFVDAQTVVAHTNSTYVVPANPITEWYEAAFSGYRGWPCSITFHQDRLIFGGSRSYPSGIWMSQVGRHNNFSSGTGLDDEAIFITLVSEQRQQICTVVSSDNLQVLTSCGEWAISNKPLTPSSVNVKQHTYVGSSVSRYLAPQKIEGQTVFVSGNLQDIRELSLDELGEHYNANDLCAMSKHLMNTPIDIAYNSLEHKLFVVMDDGTMSVLNKNVNLRISAWGKYETSGDFISVAVVDDITYVVVQHDNNFVLEKFDASALDDVGVVFDFCACGLPLRASNHNVSHLRVRKISVRLINTKSLCINDKRVELPDEIYEPGADGFSGDVSMSGLGTTHDCINSPWKIHGMDALPATVLSISMYGNYGI
ncbi:MAG: hypothetical protein J5679_02740 [Alphaproteobacteria bacterium]|nr:hypothetical protein [Alphaproteobacteria bacterium]